MRWPNGVEMTPQIDIREKLDLYNGVRPAYLYNPDHCPLKGKNTGDLDFVIIRENCEGAPRLSTLQLTWLQACSPLAKHLGSPTMSKRPIPC